MKKLLALALSALLILSVCVTAFAADEAAAKPLQFRQDGSFRILNYCDMHESYPLNRSNAAFIKESLAVLQPDLVVLGGDNCTAASADVEKCIQEICALFVDSGTYFTLVFGNHDDERGHDKQTLLRWYQQYGGAYCLAYDAAPALTGTGTHHLPILSSDGRYTAYALYMFDSNTYTYDEAGNSLGYDAVHPDEIEWYRQTSSALSAQNGGKVVPALAFQHIIVQDAAEALYYRFPVRSGVLADALTGISLKHYDGVWYTYFPKIAALRSGLLLEPLCPGYYNYGQLDAMAEVGDVQAVFSGHDHSNDFTVRIKGVDVVNTPSSSFNVSKQNINRGVRVIDLAEGESGYSTYVYYTASHVLKTDSSLPQLGEMTKTRAFFDVLANKLLNALVRVMQIPFFFAK